MPTLKSDEEPYGSWKNTMHHIVVLNKSLILKTRPSFESKLALHFPCVRSGTEIPYLELCQPKF